VAARYRLSVDELAQLYGLELAFDRPGNAWLLVGQVVGPTIYRLARLARIDPAILDAMQRSPAVPVQSSQLAYCPSCLFLNPLDVTSPCWKQESLAPSASGCAVHIRPLAQLSIGSLRGYDNFDQLLRLISRRERQGRARSRTSHPRQHEQWSC
jgi:hypothetical protein